MTLVDVLKGLNYQVLQGDINCTINKIVYDNRKATENDCFVCIKGLKVDGHSFAEDAIKNGATVVVCEKDIKSRDNIVVVKVDDTRKALAIMASNYYKNPTSKLKVIGVTGTNGKTTSVFMLKKVLEHWGKKVGLIGTVANYIGDKVLKSERTTPESLELQELFHDMVEARVDYCVMEVSSHSLELDRVYGVEFEGSIFTNLTRDHLDFHKTFENYYAAKYKLFKRAMNKAINIDDSYGDKVVKDLIIDKKEENILTFGINSSCDIKATNIINSASGVTFDINFSEDRIERVELELPGLYNVYNALGIIATCKAIGVPHNIIIDGLKHVFVPGRCERTAREYKKEYEIIIDYAHTPDGLENILQTARGFTKERLITVFGCGGDRDKVKRPQMGKIGTDLSDIAIITSDNPRTEEPMAIINEIVSGVEKQNYEVIENRYDAIKRAIDIAKEGDVIVIAGKGHEDYQILKDKVIHFDEREVVRDILNDLGVSLC